MEYPCGQCNKEVSEDEKAIQCEGLCQLWYHCVCVGMDVREYECLSSSENNWEYSTCKTDLPAFNSVDAIDVFYFYFQKNLPTPKLTVGQQFYCRLLWTYLFGIYSASTKMMMAYIWQAKWFKNKQRQSGTSYCIHVRLHTNVYVKLTYVSTLKYVSERKRT